MRIILPAMALGMFFAVGVGFAFMDSFGPMLGCWAIALACYALLKGIDFS